MPENSNNNNTNNKNQISEYLAPHHSDHYDESQIQVLEGLEAVRKRPGMYIGGTDSRALHHLVREIVDNSIDEALAGHCDRIEVTLHEDGAVSVKDNGRGVPTGMNTKVGKPTPEVVFTVLHAGGKFGGDGYNISGGLHGVGASAVNALSIEFYYEDCYEGQRYCGKFSCGNIVMPYTHLGSSNGDHGLYIRFIPDPTIFDDVIFSYDALLTMMREQAFLNGGLSLVLRDLRQTTAIEETFCYEGGVKSFVEYLTSTKHSTPVHNDVIYIAAERGGVILEVALQYNDGYNETLLSFSNNIYNTNGGTHEAGFKAALTKVLNEYARRYKILKDTDKNFAGEDVREGLVAIVSIKLPEALLKFKDQAKTELVASEARAIVDGIVSEKLSLFMEENPSVCRAILDKALAASRAREAARKAREMTRRKGVLESGSLPGKLWDCSDRSRERTELFIVEGNSAGGSAKDGRDSKFQAILPLRGKVLNVEKSRLDKVYANSQIIPIVQSLGCGIGDDFDIEKLRYGKIVLMADADVDGSHIKLLLLTFLFRHMKVLIENGHVYLARPPLFKVFRGKQVRYAFSDEERDAAIASLGNGKIEVERYKGLGEMNPELLWETTMNPQTRTLMKVEIEDALACDEILSALMGDEVEPRRDFIEKNAKFVKNLDI